MPVFSLLLLTVAVAAAESHPSWWGLASPEATALVGIHWENLRQSVFADAVGAEISSSGTLGFPDLACIKEAKQILISSPELLAIANGTFPAATVREQAVRKGLKAVSYRGIGLWISPAKATLSIAQLSDQLLLVGMRKTLEAAIDRSLYDGPVDPARQYSPLLARAARFSQTKDLWVVATRLPDSLANRFVPLDVEARDFQGAISVRDGLQLDAVIAADSEQAAAAIGETVRSSAGALPAVARGLQVTVSAQTVLLKLQVTRQEIEQAARPVAPPVPEPPAPTGPQVIRILGLDDGPREITLPPPAKPF